jgi:glutaconyl-CoA/methylmalonyl-CoA decarboxylase subunit gamma
MAGGGSLKLVVVLDGERREVEVDLARQTVRIGTHEWPLQVNASGNGSVSFEILGDRVEARGGGAGNGEPTGSIIVNGEVHSLAVESSIGSTTRLAGPRGMAAGSPASSTPHVPPEGPGQAVLPPMPGKVLEVLVRNGDQVKAGQVLLVVEAMKMRNEVTSPSAGKVSGLRVTAGANVAAREILLRVLPL